MLVQLFDRHATTHVVLYYHRVRDEDRAAFARQLDRLRRLGRVVPLDRPGYRHGSHHVSLTFDDGLASFGRNALPELEARGIPAALFVPSGLIGVAPVWETDNRHGIHEERVLTVEELRALPELIEIGSHTIDHPNMVRLPGAERQRQLVESRLALEEALDRPIRAFSFPYGAFDEDLLERSRAAGYERVYTTVPTTQVVAAAAEANGSPRGHVGRVLVDPTDWPLEFRLKVAGAYCWLPSAIAAKRGLRHVGFKMRQGGVKLAVSLTTVEFCIAF